jgi:hypothetical protein
MVKVRFQETQWELVTPPRVLNDWERSVLNTLLPEPFPERDDLRDQVETVRVFAECRCCLSIEMSDLSRAPLRPSNMHHGHVDVVMVAELYGRDADGVPMWALLFVQGGRLAELKIQRADGSPFQQQPDLRRFELVGRRQ